MSDEKTVTLSPDPSVLSKCACGHMRDEHNDALVCTVKACPCFYFGCAGNDAKPTVPKCEVCGRVSDDWFMASTGARCFDAYACARTVRESAAKPPAPDTPSPLSSLVPRAWAILDRNGVPTRPWDTYSGETEARLQLNAHNHAHARSIAERKPFRLDPLVSLEDVSSCISALESEVAALKASRSGT